MADIFESRPRADSSDVASRKIFIGGLSYSTDEDKLKRYFRDYGIVQDAVVMKDPVTKRSRGFGFITFFDGLSVDSVLAAEPHVIDGRKVEAKRAVPRSEMNTVGMPGLTGTPITVGKIGTPISSPPSDQQKHLSSGPVQNMMDENAYNKIFVGGLHYETRDQEFRDHFSRFGKVVYGEVMFNRETHKSRGFGFIVFENADSALRACDVREHILDGKVVEVKLAVPRSKLGPSTPNTPPTSMAGVLNMLTPSPPTGSMRGRTLSTGSGLSPGLPLSGNSSTLAAAHGSHKVGPGILSGNTPTAISGLRKPTSSSGLAQFGGSGSRLNPSGANYTSSLRINGSGSIDELLGEDPLAGAYVEDLVIENVRPSRALSEPIVRYEVGGKPANRQSFLHADMLNFSSFLQQPSNNPQNTSRSSSFVSQQTRNSFTMGGSISALSSEPMFSVSDSLSGGNNNSLAEKLFNNNGTNVTSTSGANNFSSLLFPGSHEGLTDPNISPSHSTKSDLLFSSPTRDIYGGANPDQPQSGGSRRSSLTGAGGDIWGASAGLSTQTTSESLWATSFSDSVSSSNGNNGLLAAINAHSYSRSTSKDDNSNANALSSLLQSSSLTSAWSTVSTTETLDATGLPPAQRRYSNSGINTGDGIAANNTSALVSPHSLMSELRMNSHEYDIPSVSSNNNTLGSTWGNGGLGY